MSPQPSGLMNGLTHTHEPDEPLTTRGRGGISAMEAAERSAISKSWGRVTYMKPTGLMYHLHIPLLPTYRPPASLRLATRASGLRESAGLWLDGTHLIVQGRLRASLSPGVLGLPSRETLPNGVPPPLPSSRACAIACTTEAELRLVCC